VVNRGIGNENARNTGLRSNGGVSVDAGLTNDSDTTRKGVTITTGTGGISISSGGNVSVSGGSGTGEQSRLATDGALSVQSGGTTTMKDTVTDAKGGSSGAPQ
jgi:hypothetical protein